MMWGKGKALLAAAIIMAFVSKASAINPQQVERGPHASVPTYFGCRNKALKKFILSGGLLQQELSKSVNFNQAWTTSMGCSKKIPERLNEHSTALRIFLKEAQPFFDDFNKAMEKLSVNVTAYEEQFHFKSFSFLLMDLMTHVPKSKCRTVFMSAHKEYRVKNGSSVRFGRFDKAYRSTSLLSDLSDITLLNITSCFFVGSNVCTNKDDSVILSPAEIFTVEDVQDINNEDDSYTMIVLNHQAVDNSQDCSTLSGAPADVSTQWLVLVLGALFLIYLQ